MEKWNKETKEQIKHLTWDLMHKIVQGIDDETVDIHAIDLVWNACANLLDSADYLACSKQTDTLDLERMRVPRAHN